HVADHRAGVSATADHRSLRRLYGVRMRRIPGHMDTSRIGRRVLADRDRISRRDDDDEGQPGASFLVLGRVSGRRVRRADRGRGRIQIRCDAAGGTEPPVTGGLSMRFETRLAAVGVLLLPLTLSAHHSPSMFGGEPLTLTGTVREFQWTNPHSYIQLVVEREDGTEQEW